MPAARAASSAVAVLELGQIWVSLGEHSYNKYMLREQIRRLKHGQLFDWGAVERGHSLNTGKYILLTIFIRSFSQSNAN